MRFVNILEEHTPLNDDFAFGGGLACMYQWDIVWHTGPSSAWHQTH